MNDGDSEMGTKFDDIVIATTEDKMKAFLGVEGNIPPVNDDTVRLNRSGLILLLEANGDFK